ncbi:MAG: TonB-dependent receptor plug domain-containing protein [Hymenobacter sp.]
MQIPPLDLRQVEIIKGASSALYGGDAIAGLVNLVTKTPTDHARAERVAQPNPQRRARPGPPLQRAHRAAGPDAAGHPKHPTAPRDVNGDGFTDLPQVQLTNVNPRLYYYLNDSTTRVRWAPRPSVGNPHRGRPGGHRDPAGGPAPLPRAQSAPAVQHPVPVETNLARRAGADAQKQPQLVCAATVRPATPTLRGGSSSTYSEASYLVPAGAHRAVFGATVTTDDFRETTGPGAGHGPARLPVPDLRAVRAGRLEAAGQPDAASRPAHRLPAALRLVRAAALLGALQSRRRHVALRAGGGYGYKAPTIFANATEQQAYVGVRALNPNTVRAETSRG